MVLKSDGADAQDCDAIRTETLSSGTTRPCGDITREAPVAEDEWNGARDEEHPFTHGRYRSLPTEELRRRQDARYRTWDVVRKDDGKLYLITSEEDPVEWEHEGCFLEGIECDAKYRPIGCVLATFMGLSVIEKVGHVSKDEVPPVGGGPSCSVHARERSPGLYQKQGVSPSPLDGVDGR